MTKRAKKEEGKPIVSFTVAKSQLLTMMGRCKKAEIGKTGKVLVAAKTSGDRDERGTITLTAAGHPVSVTCRAWSGDSEHGSVLVHHGGACVLGLEDLQSVVAAMPDDLLDILCTPSRKLVIEAAGHASAPKRRTFTVQTIVSDDYPPVPAMPAASVVRDIEGKLVAEGIERVRYAGEEGKTKSSDRDHERFWGVRLELEKDALMAVGVSGRIFARMRFAATFAEPGELFLPQPLLDLVAELGRRSDKLSFGEDGQRLYIESEFASVTCLRPVGAYPPWRSITANALQGAVAVCEIDGPQLAEALGALETVWRLSYMGSDDNKQNGWGAVRFELDGGTLHLSTGYTPLPEAELAASAEDLDVNNPQNHKLVVYVAPHLMRQGATMARGTVKMIVDPRDPLPTLLAVETLDGAFWSGICPMRPPGG